MYPEDEHLHRKPADVPDADRLVHHGDHRQQGQHEPDVVAPHLHRLDEQSAAHAAASGRFRPAAGSPITPIEARRTASKMHMRLSMPAIPE